MNNLYSRSTGIAICLSCFLFLALEIFPPAEDKIVIKIENGIPVFYNPKKPVPPAGSPRSLSLQPDLTIGEDDTDPNSMFSRLRSIQIDDQDNIYALDTKETKVKVFDKNGKFLRAFGKTGQGPGEIDRPYRMEMTRDNRLVIADMGNNKLACFGLDGSCLQEIPTGKYRALTRYKFDSKGDIYAEIRTFEETKWTSELKKFGPDLTPLATFASFEEKRPDPLLIQAFSRVYSLQTRSDDLLVWTIAQGDSYEFSIVDEKGKTIKRFNRAYDPVKIPASIKDRLRKEILGDQGIPPGIKFEVPGHFPYLDYFIIDDQDRAYVRTYAYEEKEGDYWLWHDVFDAEGRYIARFCLPEREMVFQAKRGKLYCMVQESEDGIPLVKRYQMVWN